MKVCIIGCGKMGEAMLAGWLAASPDAPAALSAPDVRIVGHTAERRRVLEERYGVRTQQDMHGIADADLIVLGVKPQVLGSVLDELAGVLAEAARMPLILSIAAGVPTTAIESALGDGARVVRAMPNTPLQVGQGATAIASGSAASDQDAQLVKSLFDRLGIAVLVCEDQIDAVGALSGAAPAYFAALVEALVAAGEEAGLPAQTACELLVQSGLGTFCLMQRTGQTPEQVRTAVCSPGGTTLAALAAMEQAGFAPSLNAGVKAAIARAKELA